MGVAALSALWLAAGGRALAQVGAPPADEDAAAASIATGGPQAGGPTTMADAASPTAQLPSAVHGAPTAPPAHVPWSALSPDQQHLLSRFSGRWDNLPPQRQQALAKGSKRWLNMTPAQRTAAQQRLKRWQSLPPNERQQLRQRWEQFRSLPPDRQRAARENFRKFERLPPQQRRELRERWRAASPAERRQMLQRARQRAFERQQLRGPRGFPGRGGGRGRIR